MTEFDLLQGMLDLLVLRGLSREPLPGWNIVARIELVSRPRVSVAAVPNLA